MELDRCDDPHSNLYCRKVNCDMSCIRELAEYHLPRVPCSVLYSWCHHHIVPPPGECLVCTNPPKTNPRGPRVGDILKMLCDVNLSTGDDLKISSGEHCKVSKICKKNITFEDGRKVAKNDLFLDPDSQGDPSSLYCEKAYRNLTADLNYTPKEPALFLNYEGQEASTLFEPVSPPRNTKKAGSQDQSPLIHEHWQLEQKTSNEFMFKDYQWRCNRRVIDRESIQACSHWPNEKRQELFGRIRHVKDKRTAQKMGADALTAFRALNGTPCRACQPFATGSAFFGPGGRHPLKKYARTSHNPPHGSHHFVSFSFTCFIFVILVKIFVREKFTAAPPKGRR
jgi:hypothetical protein